MRHKSTGLTQDPCMATLGQKLGPPQTGGSQVPMTSSDGRKNENWNVTTLNLKGELAQPSNAAGRTVCKTFSPFMLWLVKPVEFRRNV